jgi:RNA polymerase sigma-70 factor (ECF subfamily)
MPPLATLFATVWEGSVTDPDSLETRLRQALADAQTAFPGVTVCERDAVRWLAERTPAGSEPREAIEQLRISEIWLACACAHRSSRAMAFFDVLFLTPAAEALVRSGHHPADVDDALQLLRERLFVSEGRIAQFSGRGSLASWARVSLARQLTSLQRSSERTLPLADDDASAPPPSAGPEMLVTRRRYGHVFHEALKEAFAGLKHDQRTVLRLHFVDGMNLDSIAPILRVSRATAGRRILNARNALVDRVLALMGERLRTTPSEIQSVLANMWGSLSVGVGQALSD